MLETHSFDINNLPNFCSNQRFWLKCNIFFLVLLGRKKDSLGMMLIVAKISKGKDEN